MGSRCAEGGGLGMNGRVKVAVREYVALGLGSCVNGRVEVAVRELMAWGLGCGFSLCGGWGTRAEWRF